MFYVKAEMFDVFTFVLFLQLNENNTSTHKKKEKIYLFSKQIWFWNHKKNAQTAVKRLNNIQVNVNELSWTKLKILWAPVYWVVSFICIFAIRCTMSRLMFSRTVSNISIGK